MSERRGRSPRAIGVAEGVAAAVRRRQRERQPRVVVYDRSGSPKVLAPSEPPYDELLDAGGRMIEVVGVPADPVESEAGGRPADFRGAEPPG